MKNRILLNENTAAVNELITYEKNKYQNGKTLLTMLAKIGYSAECVENWEVVLQHFKKDYPNATIQFNTAANGIEQEYNAANTFYLKHRHSLRFDPITEIEIEEIQERHRMYATNENQIEAHKLIHNIVKSFNELQKMGASIDGAQIRGINRVFVYSILDKDKFQINPDALINVIQSIK